MWASAASQKVKPVQCLGSSLSRETRSPVALLTQWPSPLPFSFSMVR